MNTEDKEDKVPLLGTHRNTNRRSRHISPQQSINDTPLHQNITDFEQVDSWGMLHESDTDMGEYDNTGIRQSLNSAFIDHRPPSYVNDHYMEVTEFPVGKKKMMKKKKGLSTAATAANTALGNGQGVGRKDNAASAGPTLRNSHRTFTTGNGNGSGGGGGGGSESRSRGLNRDDVVIDVDALMDHVRRDRERMIRGRVYADAGSDDSDTGYNRTDSSDFDEEDEYNSRPSSRGSSSNSSLDDVCLVLEDEQPEGSKVWPDVSVLEEFSKEEIERLRRQALEDAEAFYCDTEEDDIFNNGVAAGVLDRQHGGTRISATHSADDGNAGSGIIFSKPMVTNIDLPELGNKFVNEADQMKNGRLRPKKLAPWHLKQRQELLDSRRGIYSPSTDTTTNNVGKMPTTSSPRAFDEDKFRENLLTGRNIQYPPNIVSNNPEHFRFTYFRIDLDATVHSPTISGLLQPGQSFEDLFVSSVYSNNRGSSSNFARERDALNLSHTVPRRSGSTSRFPTVAPMASGTHSTGLSPAGMTGTGTGTGTTGAVHSSASTIRSPANLRHTSASTVTPTGTLRRDPSALSTSALTRVTTEEDVAAFWLDIGSPTEEEMKVISKAFGIHPLTTEDIFLGEAREKVELFKDYYLICFRSFDIVGERHTRLRRERLNQDNDSSSSDGSGHSSRGGLLKFWKSWWHRRESQSSSSTGASGRAGNGESKRSRVLARSFSGGTSVYSSRSRSRLRRKERREQLKRRSGDRHKPREGELEPLNVYIIVFRTGVLTFHFAPTPHPINVRRRARILKDYLRVTADWIAYALIDDITDAFAPMIELIEDEVYDIEEAILKMNRGGSDSDSDSDGSSDSDSDSSFSDTRHLHEDRELRRRATKRPIEIKIPRTLAKRGTYGSVVTYGSRRIRASDSSSSRSSTSFSSHHKSISTSSSSSSSSSRSSDSSTFNANLIGWKKKGDMLRRIGECRKRVMSILRLLGTKADVVKGFSKRYTGQWEIAPQTEIGLYLDDIQDHIITMVSSLNHFEKLLSRSHSNYLAQINIDMTKVNNDMNDVLGKITILGTIVLPLNIITGLWGMNVLVPGQDEKSLVWFMGICTSMIVLSCVAYMYTKKRFGF